MTSSRKQAAAAPRLSICLPGLGLVLGLVLFVPEPLLWQALAFTALSGVLGMMIGLALAEWLHGTLLGSQSECEIVEDGIRTGTTLWLALCGLVWFCCQNLLDHSVSPESARNAAGIGAVVWTIAGALWVQAQAFRRRRERSMARWRPTRLPSAPAELALVRPRGRGYTRTRAARGTARDVDGLGIVPWVVTALATWS